MNSLNIIMSQNERSAHETDVLINDLYRIVLRSKNKSILFFKETNGSKFIRNVRIWYRILSKSEHVCELR